MVNVVGLGYIGLPTALMLAANDVEVVGTDYNEELVITLQQGETTFKEEGLDELFQKAVQKGIKFSDKYQKADMYIVSVPTPYDKISKKIDAKYVVAAVKSVMDVCSKGATIVIESTISPGTIDKYVRPVVEENEYRVGGDIHLVHAPERIIPGNMVYELINNSRTIGADDKEIGEQVKAVYQSFCKGDIVVTDIRTAEMTKVVENTFRDINIAFANELAKMCNRAGMDVYEIIRVANMHPRVNILTPGPGVGGHCISVDPWFLVGDYPDIVNIIRQARVINDAMPEYVLGRVSDIMKERGIKDLRRVGFYGLTYKEDVDDMRESPALQLIKCMEKHLAFGAKFYDPMVERIVVDNQYLDFDEFIKDLDLFVVLVGHSHLKENVQKLQDMTVYDTRNCIIVKNLYRL